MEVMVFFRHLAEHVLLAGDLAQTLIIENNVTTPRCLSHMLSNWVEGNILQHAYRIL